MRPLPSFQRCTSPQVRDEASERRSPATGLDGGEADDGEDVGGEHAGLALGLRKLLPPSFQRGAHARVSAGRFLICPLVDLGEG